MALSSQSLSRRVKAYLRHRKLALFVPTLPGLERVTGAELADLGYQPATTRGGASILGDLSSVYRVNVGLRSGNRVLLRVGRFLAQNYPMLYNHARSIKWEVLLGNCPSVSVKASSSESRLRRSSHLESTVFDAILDHLLPLGLSPAFARTAPLTVMVRLVQDRCVLSLDTTGFHLHRRGYREVSTEAPLRETTAAAILLRAGAGDYDVVVDPFCGSGTLLVEAERIARKVPPGLHRPLAIEHSPLHSSGKLNQEIRMLLRDVRDSRQQLLGLDISYRAVETARLVCRRAGCRSVSIRAGDARAVDFNAIAHGVSRLIVSNLPYGRRVGSEASTRQLIRDFASLLALKARGWHYAILSASDMPLQHPALHTASTMSFRNGGIPVTAYFGEVV